MAKKSLQRFTDYDFIDQLLKQSKISNEDVNNLTKRQQIILNERFVQIYNDARAERKDELLDKVFDLMPEKTRNQIWEINNMNIMNAIIDYIQQVGAMPPKTRIAEATGLSRQTINKHFHDFRNNELFRGMEDQFRFMLPKVMGEVMRKAIDGDMRAAKIYIDFVSGQNPKFQTQNNYIQINGMIFTAEKLKQLPAEQLKAIEAILTAAPDKIIECETTEKENRFTN